MRTFIPIGLLVIISNAAGDTSVMSPKESPRHAKFGLSSGSTNMIGTLAQDLISRSTTSSQVLSLNLTNLVILLVLKAILFGASNFGYGYGGPQGRSADHVSNGKPTNEVQSRSILSESELLLMLSYLQADSTQKYECLHHLACKDPSKAKEYLLAGKIFFKGTQLFGISDNRSKYADILNGLQEAVSNGLNQQDCSTMYQCSIQNHQS